MGTQTPFRERYEELKRDLIQAIRERLKGCPGGCSVDLDVPMANGDSYHAIRLTKAGKLKDDNAEDHELEGLNLEMLMAVLEDLEREAHVPEGKEYQDWT